MHARFRFLLAASLLLNLFAAGAAIGGLAALRHPGLLRHPPIPFGPLREAGDGLPPPDRARFRATMRHVLGQGRDLGRTARANRREAARLFIAPTFDVAAADAALARARAADFELRVRLETAAVAFAATLPRDERALLTQGLERRGPLRDADPVVPLTPPPAH
jgi:uncharacterized membrane protein